MRLVQLKTSGFGWELPDVAIPLGALTLLFGSNSSGKTSILEAIALLLRDQTVRDTLHPGTVDTSPPLRNAEVMLALDAAELPGHPDNMIARVALAGLAERALQPSPDAPPSWRDQSDALEEEVEELGDQLDTLVHNLDDELPSITDLRMAILARVLRSLDETHFIRQHVATVVDAALSNLVLVLRWDVALVAVPTMTEDLRVSCLQLLKAGELVESDSPDEADPDNLMDIWTRVPGGRQICEWARGLLDGGSVVLAEELSLSRVLVPKAIVLPVTGAGIASRVRKCLESLADWPFGGRGWSQSHWGEWMPHDEGRSLRRQDRHSIEQLVGRLLKRPRERKDPDPDEISVRYGQSSADRWLTAGPSDDLPASDHLYSVSPHVTWAAALVEERANAFAPTFVRERGYIRVCLLPPTVWSKVPDRLAVSFKEHRGAECDVSEVGSGMGRWIACAVELACQDLEGSVREVDGRMAGTGEDPAVIDHFLQEPDYTQVGHMSLKRPWPFGVILADEPEAHLHPRAIRSVIEWFHARSQDCTAVVIATHHPMLFDSRSVIANRVLVQRDNREIEASALDDPLSQTLARFSLELGLSESDLFLFNRYILFVEGPHDEVILRTFFGREFDRESVLIVPIMGIDNAPRLAEAEIVRMLGIRCGVLADNYSPSDSTGGRREVAAMQQLRSMAESKGWHIDEYGLEEHDIIKYLDEEVCQEYFPKFPGWAEADKVWQTGLPNRFKTFLLTRYDFSTTKEQLDAIAKRCIERERVPQALSTLVRLVLATAASA